MLSQNLKSKSPEFPDPLACMFELLRIKAGLLEDKVKPGCSTLALLAFGILCTVGSLAASPGPMHQVLHYKPTNATTKCDNPWFWILSLEGKNHPQLRTTEVR